jgi:hypothetical protein
LAKNRIWPHIIDDFSAVVNVTRSATYGANSMCTVTAIF